MKLTIYRKDKKKFATQVNLGDSLLKAISDAGVYLDAPCGGGGRCRKCLVWRAPSGGKLLACQTFIKGDMKVYVPEETQMRTSDFEGFQTMQYNENITFGVAVDVGTTVVAVSLIDMDTGGVISTASEINTQRICGADVISRINHCVKNSHENLTKLIRSQIQNLINKNLLNLGISEDIVTQARQQIKSVVIAGNTIMQHLVYGLSPIGMGTLPFEPTSLFGVEADPWEGLTLSNDGKIYYTPAISSYVGGDITAGLLVAHDYVTLRLAPNRKEPIRTMLFLDIGTNGEIVLKNGDKYFACATSAGPSFEGAEIEMGMAAINGAISHVNWDKEENKLKLTVIEDEEPAGICGSGLVDTLSYLVENGKRQAKGESNDPSLPHVDETGRLLINAACPEALDRFFLTDSVYLTAKDVRKLQLAKAAIAAGIQTLLKHANISEKHIDCLILAGGFGNYLDKESVVKIRLIPKSLLPVMHSLGNAALIGATKALHDKEAKAKLEAIVKQTKYIELSTDKTFNIEFIDQMKF